MEQGAEVKVDLELDALGDQIAEMSAHIDAAMHRLLTAIRRFGNSTLRQDGMCRVRCLVRIG